MNRPALITNKKAIAIFLIYGVVMATIVFLMKMLDYRLFIRDISLEIYVGSIATLFTAFGIWLGLKLTRKKQIVLNQESEWILNQQALDELNISKRELEVLEQMAAGLSNQEIADQLFISLNTVKTHTSNLYVKLDVKRRTQALQKGKELRLIR